MTFVRTITGKGFVKSLTDMNMSPTKFYKRPFTVCIEGNIGSGKTTFISHFKKFNNVTVLQEPVELWRNVAGSNLLDLMYQNPQRHAFLFQSYVQLTMLKLHSLKSPLPYKVMERSAHSGMCFIENMKRTKVLSEVEVTILRDWYNWSIESSQVTTDLIIYLRTTPEVVFQRMKSRARKEEMCVLLEYLKQIHEIHDEWLYKQTLFSVPAPVIVLDGDKTLEGMLEEFEKCKNQIFSGKIEDKDGIRSTVEVIPKKSLTEITQSTSN